MAVLVFSIAILRSGEKKNRSQPNVEDIGSRIGKQDRGVSQVPSPRDSPFFQFNSMDSVDDDNEYVGKLEQYGAQIDIVFHVHDESNKPISNAHVVVSSTMGEEDERSMDGFTNAEGVFSFHGWSNWSVGWTVTSDGFYGCHSNLVLRPFSNVRAWQERCWFIEPLDITVMLLAKDNPHEMLFQDISLSLPDQGIPVGFDLLGGDVLSANSIGTKEDIVFISDCNPLVWGNEGSSRSVLVRFPNPGDGVVITNLHGSSYLRVPRLAPLDGYSKEFSSSLFITNGHVSHANAISSDSYLVFRIRSQLSNSGEVTNAIYGKMRGDWFVNGRNRLLRFKYWVNWNAGERNIEDTSGYW